MSPPLDDEGGSRGWIALHRKLTDHPRYRDSEFIHVWIHLLLRATHKPHRVIWCGKETVLQPGQLITGRHAIARDTGVNASKVKRILALLKTDQQIDQQPGNKSSITTVLNWHKYQFGDQQIDQQVTSKRPASDQQVTTNNNGKNGENAENGELTASSVSLLRTEQLTSEAVRGARHRPKAVNESEAELMERIADAVGLDDMALYGGDWRKNYVRKFPKETRVALDEFHMLAKEGQVFRTPGAWLKDKILRLHEESKINHQ